MTARAAPPKDRSLAAYAAKRDFTRTAEPAADHARSAAASPIFVIQKHAARRLHYDLRLEHAGRLLSWAVPQGLSEDPAVRRLAMRTEDHPLAYATFEGRIPEGQYGAGAMIIWDHGALHWLSDPEDGLARGKLEVALEGRRIRATYHLVRIKPRAGESGEPWLVFKARPRGSNDAPDGGADAPTQASIVSGRTLDEVAARQPSAPARLPAFRAPALATPAAAPPAGGVWVHEVKYDGYRLQAAIDGADVRLFTRSGLDWTTKFPRLADALADLVLDRALIDGEAVVVDAAGRTSFAALQAALGAPGGASISYFAFDLLALGGEDLARAPLTQRKTRLRTALRNAPSHGPVHYGDHVEGDGAAMLAHVCAAGLEGIVSKRADAPYPAGRSTSWLKTKCALRREFVIGGWTPSTRGRGFASVLVGEWDAHGLAFRGRIGSGFDARALTRLTTLFAARARKTSPFADLPPSIARGARFIEPDLVIEARMTEVTPAGHVRHGVFLGLREDKPASEVRMETERPSPEPTPAKPVRSGRLTHPDKILVEESGLTKAALADYFAAVAPRMAPFALNRPISLVRCPGGRAAKCFFQKHATAGFPSEFGAVDVRDADGETKRYLVAPAIAAIEACAQIGAVEVHVWGARADKLERPDRLVIDLDPDEALPFERVRAAALDVRDLFAHAGLATFALLTGGKGVHVVAPLARRQDWPIISSFAAGIAHKLEELDPARFIATMSKAKRVGKIFVDHLRNRRGATAIAPYSPRARAGAPAAAPVTWNELREVERADAFDLTRAAARARGGDPWSGYSAVRQSLTQTAFKALGLSLPIRN